MSAYQNFPRLALCPFAVIGDPTPREFLRRMKIYLDARPDFLELGLPFSDPIADGPVIQAADERALRTGMTTKKALAMVKKVRSMTDIPIGLMTYANLPVAYGIERFYKDCARAGITSVLPADAPFEESGEFRRYARATGIQHIFMIAENTPLKRIKEILGKAEGFLYIVSRLGVTGARKKINARSAALLKKIRRHTELPLAVGFGISKPSHLAALKKMGAQAAIIGSALVKTPTRMLPGVLSAFMKSR